MRFPNGYGGIVNLGKKRRRPYGVRITAGYTKEGKAIYKYLGYYAKRQDALAALAEYNLRPYDIDGRNKTFAEVYELASKAAFREASHQKIVSYKAAYKKCAAIHNMKISQIKTAELQSVLDNCDTRSLSSLNNIKVVFHTVFKYALQNDFIIKDYSEFVRIDNTSEKKNKTIFTDDEINRLWKNENDFYCRVVLILIYSGFRINELLTLKVENVNLGDGYMQGGLKTKNGKNRIVPIHSRIESFIEDFYNPENEFLINRNGKKVLYHTFKNNCITTLNHLGINHTLHECRHTTASLLNRYGAKDTNIKKLLGHSTGDLTKDVYTHVQLTELKQTISLIP